MPKPNNAELPLILACSGCSQNAHIASDLAKVMDTEGFAKLTSSVKLINAHPNWVKQVSLGRPIMLIDGCNKCCTQHLLATYCINETWYINLHDYGFNQTIHGLHHVAQLQSVMRTVQNILTRAQK